MREETRRWMQSDVREDLRRLANWLKENRKAVLVVFVWGIAMALITSSAFWVVYLEDPARFRLGLNISWSLLNVASGVPRLGPLQYVLFFAVSLVAGLILTEVDVAMYSYIAAFIVMLLVAFVHAFLFIWFVLPQPGSVADPSFISTIMFSAFLSVMRLIFPFTILLTFFSGLFGAFVRDLVRPSARSIMTVEYKEE